MKLKLTLVMMLRQFPSHKTQVRIPPYFCKSEIQTSREVSVRNTTGLVYFLNLIWLSLPHARNSLLGKLLGTAGTCFFVSKEYNKNLE